MNVQEITFPEEDSLVPKSPQRKVAVPPALKFITSLLYKSAVGITFLYILSILVVQPLLEVQYERRSEYVQYALRRVRQLLNTLALKKGLPVVAVKRNGRLYSEAATQTVSEQEQKERREKDLRQTLKYGVTFEDQADATDHEGNLVRDKLGKLKESLEHYKNYCCDIEHINPLSFQLKKFQGTIDGYRYATLFKAGRQMAGVSSTADFKKEIRTIKGWYLSGQV